MTVSELKKALDASFQGDEVVFFGEALSTVESVRRFFDRVKPSQTTLWPWSSARPATE
jgi:hypothetical protein